MLRISQHRVSCGTPSPLRRVAGKNSNMRGARIVEVSQEREPGSIVRLPRGQRAPKEIVLDLDGPIHGEQTVLSMERVRTLPRLYIFCQRLLGAARARALARRRGRQYGSSPASGRLLSASDRAARRRASTAQRVTTAGNGVSGWQVLGTEAWPVVCRTHRSGSAELPDRVPRALWAADTLARWANPRPPLCRRSEEACPQSL